MNPTTFIERQLIMVGTSVNEIINNATSAGSDKANEINQKVDVLGGSAISVVTRVGMILAVIAMICCGIGLIISNANKREEAKERLIWGLIGSGIIFAATGIINIVQATVNGMGF